ncbi:hypothetical protein J14TS2_16020 [Bacillus sp. J14TS2]|uniref:hypothetical protein n=1 Tax=Bacillus sp. J14TS2 TaxID=2807188 RepID=UPI001B079B41|nr:hypothetical protein [Bacillus sp. J14TS2]GIN71127.1 hypothetical protein J14TS2_16020 [Bacillus sp. J14TS2]
MAKLTARFGAEDKITRKLTAIRREAEKLERVRSKTNRPLIITAKDRATPVMRRISDFVRRRMPRTYEYTVRARDLSTATLRKIQDQIKRRMPRTYEFGVRAHDRATSIMRRINGYVKANILGTKMLTILAMDKASPVIRRISTYVRTTLGRGYSFTVRATDMVTKTVGRISAFARSSLPRTINTTVRVIDMATRPLRAIAGAATSTLGLLGVAGGVGGGIVVPVKMVADREDLTTAFEVMLGSAEAANQRMEELTSFAGRTPLTRDEIFRSSRVLQTFTGDVLSTAKGMELIGDVAVGTQTSLEDTATWFGRLYDGLKSGRPIGDATARLQEMGAISGKSRARIEELGESGKSIEKIWPAVTKEFSTYNGMMEKMSHNMSNLLLGLKSFVGNTILMPWGEGLRDAFKPALLAFREWRGEYSFVLADLSKSLKSWGTSFADQLLKPTSGVLGFLGEQMKILFPGKMTEELKLKMKDDPELEHRFKQLEKYRGMTFEARWSLVKANVGNEIEEWWDTKGRAGAEKVGQNIGRTYGGFIRSAIVTLLGGEVDESGNMFIDAGATSGKNFIAGFLEALDPGDLAIQIGKKLGQINLDAGKSMYGHIIGDEELANSGSIAGALLADYVALAFLSGLAGKIAPAGTLIKNIGKGASKLAGKTKRAPVSTPEAAPIPPKGKTPWFNWSRGTEPKTTKPPVYKNPWTGEKPKLNVPNAQNTWTGKLSKQLSTTTKDTGKWTKALGGLGKFGKRIPVLGTLLGGAAIATSSKEERPGVIGNVAGGAAGAAAGATLGSVVPVVGTAIGGIVGGILGSIGGEKIAEWLSENWTSIKDGAKDAATAVGDWFSNAGTWIADTWSSVSSWFISDVWNPIIEGGKSSINWIKNTWGSVSSWFMDSVWTPTIEGAQTAIEWVGEKFAEGSQWVSEKWSDLSGWFVANVWTPLQDTAINTINFAVGLFDMWREKVSENWATVSGWFVDNVWTPIKNTASEVGGWISDRFKDSVTWVKETYGTFMTWFEDTVWNPLRESVWDAVRWIGAKFIEASVWVKEQWNDFSGWFEETIWAPVKENAAQAATWIYDRVGEAKIWIQEKWADFSNWFEETIWTPVKTGAQAVGQWFSDTFQNAKTWVQETWVSVSGWFEETVWTPIKMGVGGAALWISAKYQEAKAWVQETWASFSSWFEESVWTPVKQGAEAVGTWIGERYDAAKSWVQEAWGSVAGWFQDTIWSPIKDGAQEAADWIGGVFDSAKEKITGAWNWAKGIWGDVKSWTTGVTERGSSLTGLKNSRQQQATQNATGGYITKPTLSWIGEAGNEYVIPTENNLGRGRMLLGKAAADMGMKLLDKNDQETNSLQYNNREAVNDTKETFNYFRENNYTNKDTFNTSKENILKEKFTNLKENIFNTRDTHDEERIFNTKDIFNKREIINTQREEYINSKQVYTGTGAELRTQNLEGETELDSEFLEVALRLRKSEKGSGFPVNLTIQFNGDNHYSEEMDAEKVAKIAGDTIVERIKDGLNSEGEGAYDL